MIPTPALAAALAATLASHAAAQSVAATPAPTQQAADRVRLDERIPALMTAAGVPGVSMAVLRGGSVAFTGAYGVRNLQTGEVVDSTTVFDAASLTKPVFAFAVLRLADRGLIALDRPIAHVLPNRRMQHDARYRRITPRMVLSHGTGLPNWGGDSLGIAFDPGTNWGYSGEGYVWLSEAIEKATGTPIQDVMHAEVFGPLGMRHSALAFSEALERNGAASHSQWGVARARGPAPDGRTANAAASLRTTAADYAKFLGAVFAGRGLSPAMAREYLSVQNETVNAPSYRTRPAELRARIAWAAGWGLERRDGRMLIWHWGDNGDAKAFVAGDPASGTAVVYFANSANGLAVARAVVDAVLPGEAPSLQWLRYEQHDEPRFIARRAIVRAALDDSAASPDASARAYAAQRSAFPGAVTPALVASAANALGGLGKVAAGDTLLALAARDYPDSASLVLARGDLQLGANEPAHALPHYQRAASLMPGDSVARIRAAWVTDMIAAAGAPASVDERTLQQYAGQYGPRRVTFENGRLHYQRGSGRKAPMTAMSHDTFMVDGIPTFRLKFVALAGAPASRVIGLYHDGSRDANERSP